MTQKPARTKMAVKASLHVHAVAKTEVASAAPVEQESKALKALRKLHGEGKQGTINPKFDGAYGGKLVYDPSFVEYHNASLTDMVNYRPLVNPQFPSPDVKGVLFYNFMTFGANQFDPVPLPVTDQEELIRILNENVGDRPVYAWQKRSDSDDIDYVVTKILDHLFGGTAFWHGVNVRTYLVDTKVADIGIELARFADIGDKLKKEEEDLEPAISQMIITPFDIHPVEKPQLYTVFLRWIQEYLKKPADYFYTGAVRARKDYMSSSSQYTQYIEQETRERVIFRAKKSESEDLKLNQKYGLLEAVVTSVLNRRQELYNNPSVVGPLMHPYTQKLEEMVRFKYWNCFLQDVDAGRSPEPWLYTSDDLLAKYQSMVLKGYQDMATIYLHIPDARNEFWKDGLFDVKRAEAESKVFRGIDVPPMPAYSDNFFRFNKDASDIPGSGWDRGLYINPYDPLNMIGSRMQPLLFDWYFGRMQAMVIKEAKARPEMFENPAMGFVHCLCKLEWGVRQYLRAKFINIDDLLMVMKQIVDALFFIEGQKSNLGPNYFLPTLNKMKQFLGEDFKDSVTQDSYLFKAFYGTVYMQTYLKKVIPEHGAILKLPIELAEDDPRLTTNYIDWDMLRNLGKVS